MNFHNCFLNYLERQHTKSETRCHSDMKLCLILIICLYLREPSEGFQTILKLGMNFAE